MKALKSVLGQQGVKSSLYGPRILGYTRAATLKTIRRENENSNWTVKIN